MSAAAAAALVLLSGALWMALRREALFTAEAAPGAAGGEPERTLPAADSGGARFEPAADPGEPAPADERLGAAAARPVDPLEPARERDAYRAFVEQESREKGSLDRRAREVLDGESPAHVKVAFLRAAYRTRTAQALEHFDWVVRNLPDAPTPAGESCPAFAVRFLGERSAADPSAREALGKIAFQGRAPGIGLRRRAAADFARTAADEELGGLAAWLAAESDRQLVDGVVAALGENPARGATSLAARFGATGTTVREEQE